MAFLYNISNLYYPPRRENLFHFGINREGWGFWINKPDLPPVQPFQARNLYDAVRGQIVEEIENDPR